MEAGILSVMAAAVLLGIIPSAQKQLLLNGMSQYSMLLFTNITILVFNLTIVVIKQHRIRVDCRQLLQCAAMAIMGQVLTGVFLTASYLHISIAMATMINFLYPAFVCAAMALGRGKKLSAQQIAAIALSASGMAFLTGTGGDISIPGIALALASAFTYSGYLICGEVGPANTLPIDVKLLLISVVSTVCYALLCVCTGSLSVPNEPVEWLMLLGASGLFNALGLFGMLEGITRLGAATASFLSALEPVVAVIFGVLWFRDPIGQGTTVGGLLIFASMLLAVRQPKAERKNK